MRAMNFIESYKPFDFTAKRIFVYSFVVTIDDQLKVVSLKFKLPAEIRTLKGFFATANEKGFEKFLGNLVLRFDEGRITPITFQVPNAQSITPFDNLFRLDEKLLPGSIVQGFYEDYGIARAYPYTIKIYLIYDNLFFTVGK
jgi:hypothetical protein